MKFAMYPMHMTAAEPKPPIQKISITVYSEFKNKSIMIGMDSSIVDFTGFNWMSFTCMLIISKVIFEVNKLNTIRCFHKKHDFHELVRSL